MSLRVERVDATFGAVVTGLRLAAPDDRTWDELHELWLEHALLIFPDQHLDRDAQVAFARRFGGIELLGGHEVVPLSNVRRDGTLRDDDDVMKVLRGNMGWHADSTYMPVQAKGAVFAAEVVPDEGGETGWADMRAAYDALDDATRALVHARSAHHSLAYSQAKVGHTHHEGSDYSGYGFHGGDDPLRPLVKVHPETGRPSLLIGRHAHSVPGMDPAGSERFLEGLVEEACQRPRTHHHRWSPGDVVVWDNRCLLHHARPWPTDQARIMWHCRIAGDPASELAASGAGTA